MQFSGTLHNLLSMSSPLQVVGEGCSGHGSCVGFALRCLTFFMVRVKIVSAQNAGRMRPEGCVCVLREWVLLQEKDLTPSGGSTLPLWRTVLSEAIEVSLSCVYVT